MNRTFEMMQSCLLMGFEDILPKDDLDEGKRNRNIMDRFKGRLSQDAIEAILYQRCIEKAGPVIAADSLAYIANIAGKIAEDEPGSNEGEKAGRLESIFNRLNQHHGQAYFSANWDADRIQYPEQDNGDHTDDYQRVLNRWESCHGSELFGPARANALIDSMDAYFSYVPAPCASGRRDISLFHYSKATAAIACCIERWLSQKGIKDYREALLEGRSAFMQEKAFLLYSLDLSGIQTFIYTISNKGALKGLRVRSFYLSLMMEHIADMILEACGLYRVNLIYSGGGRAHLLLPNDGVCIGHAEETVALVNRFLMSRFGTSLFLARGCAEATANELSSAPGEGNSFPDVFRTASSVISRQKLQRYNAEEISVINRKQESHSTDRECVICGRSGRLIAHGDKDEMICETCASLEAFSNTLTKSEFFLAVRKGEHGNAIPLPGDMWLECIDRKSLQADQVRKDDAIVRIYSINSRYLDIPKTINLRFGNYQPWNGNGSSMTFEQLADSSRGVKRLGVLRADVDNLGALFAAGFVDHKDAHPYRYTTLPRSMALSAALTAFFQQEINRIVEESGRSWMPDAEPSKQRRVSIVYSGGDDVFLIGAWNEVLDAGLALQSAFRRYTGGSVTLSAGLGIFPPHEPVGVMANVTADLEEAAKLIGDGEKNAVALFGPVFPGGASPVFRVFRI